MGNTSLYNTYSEYLKNKYGEKVYKLPVNLPLTCPNRLDGNGCTFCADAGTGFEALGNNISVIDQLSATKEKIQKRYKAFKYIAYFQNYTNTFLPLDLLLQYMREAVLDPEVVEICISTRPDCISDAYLKAFDRFNREYGVEITIELGLQTVNYHTLRKINRGHSLAEFLDAVLRISRWKFPICAHLILNLPGDCMEDVQEAAKIISTLPISMVKLHSLYIPNHCDMAKAYEKGELKICSKEEYLERLAEFISLLRPDMVVERLFSRIPEKDAMFSNWGCSWWKLADEWEKLMHEKEYRQGCRCDYMNGPALNRLELAYGRT